MFLDFFWWIWCIMYWCRKLITVNKLEFLEKLERWTTSKLHLFHLQMNAVPAVVMKIFVGLFFSWVIHCKGNIKILIKVSIKDKTKMTVAHISFYSWQCFLGNHQPPLKLHGTVFISNLIIVSIKCRKTYLVMSLELIKGSSPNFVSNINWI